jgi:hypothetical protein
MIWGDDEPKQDFKGKCKHLKVYHVSNLGQTGYGFYNSYAFIGGNVPDWGQHPITNDNITFTDDGMEIQETEDFANIFGAATNQPRTFNISIKSSDS